MVKGKFGSVDINYLAQNYMSLSKEQEIPGRMEFEDVKFEGTFFFLLFCCGSGVKKLLKLIIPTGLLSVRNLDTADGKISNINLQELNDRILKTTETQNVTASYYIDEVYFQGKLKIF